MLKLIVLEVGVTMFKRWKQFLENPNPAMMLFRLIVMLGMVSANFYDSGANNFFDILAVIFFFVSYLCILYFKKRQWIFFVLELIISLLLGYLYMENDFPYTLLVGLVGIGLFINYEGKFLYISWSLLFILMIICELFFELHSDGDILINYSFIIFASLTGGLIRYAYQMKNQSMLLYQELDSSYQKLQKHAQTVEKLAMQEERDRITREIHDTVGHVVTALIFQLEAAQKIMDKDPQKSYTLMKTSEELARSIYQEIRFSIETNYQEGWENLDLNTLLQQLINDFSLLTQLEVNYQIVGQVPSSLSRQYKFNLYRILQETLTNAKRHGFAKQVWITLTFHHQNIQFQIEDDGIGTDQLHVGFGLKNLQNRVEGLEGTCHFYTSKGKGFRTEISLPLMDKEADK
jgi:signal transduction histidine kinase